MELERVIGERLREMGRTLSVAESCTGGLVSDRITNISGSSDYFEGGIVSYSINAKAQHLGIPLKYIHKFGAVSPQVAKKMAEGVRQAFHTTCGLSTTGVAGPTGGTKRIPVGTVFVGIACERETYVEKLNLRGSRREIKEKATEESLRILFEQLARSVQNTEGGLGVRHCIEELTRSPESTILMIRKAPQGISNRTGRLGIFPASFNPPTMAHLVLIREAEKQGNLDEVLVLLDIQAMDKEPVEATFEDRLWMVKKVFGRDPKISIGLSNRGLFLQKVKPLRKYYPSSTELFFIVGLDTIFRIMDKRYYRNRKKALDELFSECRFMVANRGNQERAAFEIFFRRIENKRYRDKVFFIPLHPRYSSISSTTIRKKITKGEPVDGLVPASIHQVIKKKFLYTEK